MLVLMNHLEYIDLENICDNDSIIACKLRQELKDDKSKLTEKRLEKASFFVSKSKMINQFPLLSIAGL